MADSTTSNANTQAERNEAAKKQLADQKTQLQEARQKLAEDMAGVKPTPTQTENDEAAMGIYNAQHEADGSPEQPPTGTPRATTTRALEAQKPAPAPSSGKSSYSTKASE